MDIATVYNNDIYYVIWLYGYNMDIIWYDKTI